MSASKACYTGYMLYSESRQDFIGPTNVGNRLWHGAVSSYHAHVYQREHNAAVALDKAKQSWNYCHNHESEAIRDPHPFDWQIVRVAVEFKIL